MTGASGLARWLDSGIWLFLPPLAIAQAFASRYPPTYRADTFTRGIPASLLTAESTLRALVIAVALVMPVSRSSTPRPLGIAVYLIGLGAYTASWALLWLATGSAWSRSPIGLTAPAWTPAVWLAGVAMLTGHVRGLPWSQPWMYLVLCVAFLGVHITHVTLAVTR